MFPDKVYQVLKWTALIAVPAIEALWLVLALTWGWDYGVEVGATIASAGVFLGALIGVSTTNYNNKQKEAAYKALHELEGDGKDA